jgi:hypothetical protein
MPRRPCVVIARRGSQPYADRLSAIMRSLFVHFQIGRRAG